MAKGVFLGVACTLTILPALIMTFRRSIQRHTHPTFIPKLTRTAGFVVKRRVPILLIFIFLFFHKFQNEEKFPTGKVLESNYLPKHTPLRFQGLKQADKHPLCTPLEL